MNGFCHEAGGGSRQKKIAAWQKVLRHRPDIHNVTAFVGISGSAIMRA